RAVRVLGPPLKRLAQGAISSAPVKSVVGEVADAAIAFFGDPAKLASLGSIGVGALLPVLADVGKKILDAVLTAVVPAEQAGALHEALGKVAAALQSPSTLLEAAGQAAAQAIEQVLSPLLLRIDDPALRDLASGVLAAVRDLVTNSTAGNSLRSEAKALLGRLAQLGVRYLVASVTGALPAGPAREV